MLELPATAAWRHLGAQDGFEVLFLRRETDGYHLEGQSTAVEEGEIWGVSYTIDVDASWRTRSAHIVGRSALGAHQVRLEGDGVGGWRVDGKPEPLVAGCLDVDLEASAFTNAFPVNRLRLDVGQASEAPAAYVRALDLSVERLEQSYVRLDNDGDQPRYDYAGPRFGYRDVLIYDRFGLILDYPGIAVRVA
jgi:uncharacterized protein